MLIEVLERDIKLYQINNNNNPNFIVDGWRKRIEIIIIRGKEYCGPTKLKESGSIGLIKEVHKDTSAHLFPPPRRRRHDFQFYSKLPFSFNSSKPSRGAQTKECLNPKTSVAILLKHPFFVFLYWNFVLSD